jgi:hypothetical protein
MPTANLFLEMHGLTRQQVSQDALEHRLRDGAAGRSRFGFLGRKGGDDARVYTLAKAMAAEWRIIGYGDPEMDPLEQVELVKWVETLEEATAAVEDLRLPENEKYRLYIRTTDAADSNVIEVNGADDELHEYRD